MNNFRAVLSKLLDEDIIGLTPLGGGDVADSYQTSLGSGDRVFAKTKRDAPTGFFVTEAAGLEWLGEAAAVPVPKVIAVSDDPAVLVLEWIELGTPHQSTEADFGRSLAALHAAGSPCFGREDRRSTGSRGLPNEPAATWAEFYAESRLRPLARLATDAAALPTSAIRRLELVADNAADLVGPAEVAAAASGQPWRRSASFATSQTPDCWATCGTSLRSPGARSPMGCSPVSTADCAPAISQPIASTNSSSIQS